MSFLWRRLDLIFFHLKKACLAVGSWLKDILTGIADVLVLWTFFYSRFSKLAKWVKVWFRDCKMKMYKDIRSEVAFKNYNKWTGLRRFCVVATDSSSFEGVMLLAIIVNSVISAISSDHEVKNDGEIPVWIEIAELGFLSLYTTEFIMKFIGHLHNYFRDGWNILDFCILVISYLPYITQGFSVNLKFLRTFRALRGARILRTVEFWTSLQVLWDAVTKTVTSAIWLIALLGIFILVFAIAALYLFGEKVPDPWGNLFTSLLNVFAITTKDAWNVYQDDLDEAYGLVSRFYSVIVVIVCGLIISSLVVASVTDNFEDSAKSQLKKERKERKKKVQKYREEDEEKTEKKRNKQLQRACQDSAEYEEKKGDYKINNIKLGKQKNMFCNLNWMKASWMNLAELEVINDALVDMYERVFENLYEVSEMNARPDPDDVQATDAPPHA